MKMRYNPTILVVDDHEDNIAVLLGALNSYDVIPAKDGISAIEILKEEKVDLILLDVMMPKMDGFEVCKYLKDTPEFTKIPIIFLTAKNDIEDIKRGFEYGAIDYLTKPFNPLELTVRINTHIELLSYKNSLEQKVEETIIENKLQQEILFQKAKQAEIGELLMHISHQWKQPLSELGSINTFQMGMLETNHIITPEEHKKYLRKNCEIIDFMAETMETFQHFYQPNQVALSFKVSEAIQIAMNIVSATFHYNEIEIEMITPPKEYFLFGNQNEYAQIFLALLNNAKNIFLARKILNPKVKIEFEQYEENLIVKFSDNGGGIEQINEDIFNAFVSFNKSTGIGLYMVKAICKKNFWKIECCNQPVGAEFKITSQLERDK